MTKPTPNSNVAADQDRDPTTAGFALLVISIIGILLSVIYAALFTIIQEPIWLKQGSGIAIVMTKTVLAILFPVAVALISWIAINRVGEQFIRELYQPENPNRVRQIIANRMFGVVLRQPPIIPIFRSPSVKINSIHFEDKLGLRWMGGPAKLSIDDGYAAYIEKGDHFSHVLGPGSTNDHILERQEKLRAVIDSRPQVNEGVIKAWSKDGIPMKIFIRLECQVSTRGVAENAKLLYPFNPSAVQQLVEHGSILKDHKSSQYKEVSWVETIWKRVTSAVGGYALVHSLDDLIHGEQVQILAPSVVNDIVASLNETFIIEQFGGQVNHIQITGIEFPPKVNDHRLKILESEKNLINKKRAGELEAEQIQLREKIRTEIQEKLLAVITDRLRQVTNNNWTEPILLSLTGILDSDLDDPLVRPLIAKESISLLEKLRAFLKQGFK